MQQEWDLFEEVLDQDDSSGKGIPCCFMCKMPFHLLTNDIEGSIVCSDCGTVNQYLIEKKSDLSNAIADGTNINIYVPRSSLGTSIAGHTRMKIRIVNDWGKWIYKERSFYDDKRDIEERCRRGKITQAVIDNSLNLYKRVADLKHTDGKSVIIRGINRKAIMAAAVYYGARLQRQPRCPKEIAELFDLELGQITKGCKRFSQMVNMSELTRDNPRNEAYDYVYSLCHRLDMEKEFKEKSFEIVQNIGKLQLATNHQPPAVAASTILLTKEFLGNQRPTKKFREQLSEIFRVSDVTIQKTFKELRPWIRVLTNTSLTEEHFKKAMDIVEGGSLLKDEIK